MSDNQNKSRHTEKTPVQRKEMSRRQFLNYTLGGTGGFLMALPLISNIRFAVDPLLQPKKETEYIKVVEEAMITAEPAAFKFQVHQVDGWYESDPEFEAWISRDQDGNIFALSPVCKHLGCTINWNTSPAHPNHYFCPCHGAYYTKDGKAMAVAPLPLDEYSVKLDNGFVYLGPIKPNTRVK